LAVVLVLSLVLGVRFRLPVYAQGRRSGAVDREADAALKKLLATTGKSHEKDKASGVSNIVRAVSSSGSAQEGRPAKSGQQLASSTGSHSLQVGVQC
jgi:hypothetical protein